MVRSATGVDGARMERRSVRNRLQDALDRLYAARDRLLARPDFQAFAARFPLTRAIARRRASALFDLTAGFVYTQILSACAKLDLLAILAKGPRTAGDLAHLLALEPAATTRLLRAAVALGLVAHRGRDAQGETRYGLGMDGAALLGNPGALAMIAHHDAFYADLADPIALLRGTRQTQLARFWPYAAQGAHVTPADAGAYSDLMGASQALVSDDLLAAYDFARHRRLVDAGGGNGTFLRRVAAGAPALELVLFDLPAVAERARESFCEAGLGARAKVHGGDLWRDPWPVGADLITLVRVLHDHDDARALDLLRRARGALAAGGTLIVAEPMSGAGEQARVGDAYFGFYFAAMGSGRARAPAEIEAMMRRSGFARTRRLSMARPLLCSAISAEAS